jgi:hypothetical protein
LQALALEFAQRIALPQELTVGGAEFGGPSGQPLVLRHVGNEFG